MSRLQTDIDVIRIRVSHEKRGRQFAVTRPGKSAAEGECKGLVGSNLVFNQRAWEQIQILPIQYGLTLKGLDVSVRRFGPKTSLKVSFGRQFSRTVLQINLTPEQFEKLLDDQLAFAFANHLPAPSKGSDLPEFLTREQTKEFLQVSYTTLNTWAKDTPDRSAILIPKKINGQVRYERASVLATLKEHRRFRLSTK